MSEASSASLDIRIKTTTPHVVLSLSKDLSGDRDTLTTLAELPVQVRGPWEEPLDDNGCARAVGTMAVVVSAPERVIDRVTCPHGPALPHDLA